MKPISSLSTALALVACLAFAHSTEAEVYKWVDENGVVHYTDRPPERGHEITEMAIPTTPEPAAPLGEAAEAEAGPPWYEQWLAEQRQRRATEQQARQAASTEKSEERATMLEACTQARQRVKILETPCRVFFDGQGILRTWCRFETTFAYKGEFRFLEDDERNSLLHHYRAKVEECKAAGY